MTHVCQEASSDAATAKIGALTSVSERLVKLRVEELG
jgi:hypothetical protein